MLTNIPRPLVVIVALAVLAALAACAFLSPPPSPRPQPTAYEQFAAPTSKPTHAVPKPPTQTPPLAAMTPTAALSPLGNPSYPGRVSVPDAINLVRRGDFGAGFDKDWKFTTEREHGRGDAGEITPSFEGQSPGGINFINIARRDSNHAEVDLTQQIDRVVPAGGWMQARVVFRIWSHDVPRCGEFGTECPVMLKLRWESADGQEHEWIQGFYVLEAQRITEPAMCDGCEMPRPFVRVPLDEWYAYESPNLLFDLHDKSSQNLPHRVKSITLAASGHSFQVQFAEVSLLVRNTPFGPVNTSPSRTYLLRRVTVRNLLAYPPRPGEDVDLEAYFSQEWRTVAHSSLSAPLEQDTSACYLMEGASLTDIPYVPLLPDLLRARVAPGSSVRTIPLHARLRGHFDRTLSYCPSEDRMFTVVDIVQNYCEGNCPPGPQTPLPGLSARDLKSLKHYEDSETGLGLYYWPTAQVRKCNDGSIELMTPTTPRIIIRRHPNELQSERLGTVATGILPGARLVSYETLKPGTNWTNAGGYVLRWENDRSDVGLVVLLVGKEHLYAITCQYPIYTADTLSLTALLEQLVPGFTAPDLTP